MYVNKALVSQIGRSKKIQEWQEQLVQNSSQLVTGLAGSAKSASIATLLAKENKILVVTPN